MAPDHPVRHAAQIAQAQIAQDAADRIRLWLVQSYRYTASTIELNEMLVREINRALSICDAARLRGEAAVRVEE